MKAVICTKYGAPEVLEVRDIPRPIPKDKEVLIKIIATTVHIGDTKLRSFEPGLGPLKDFLFKPIMRIMIGFTKPWRGILGMELAGIIEDVGKDVTLFKKGDEIMAATGLHFAAYAEYVCLKEKGIITKKPENFSFEEAAPIVNGGITALNILQNAKVQEGQKVLIYGASGSVGTYAVQLAINMGAIVSAVCSTKNIELVKSLGCVDVIDYTKEDFTERNDRYDVIFDAVGKLPFKKRKTSLTVGGKYLNVLTASDGIKLRVEDLNTLKSYCEEGKLKPVIDRTYSLDQIVEAHHYVDKGHKVGNVVIKVV